MAARFRALARSRALVSYAEQAHIPAYPQTGTVGIRGDRNSPRCVHLRIPFGLVWSLPPKAEPVNSSGVSVRMN